LFPRQHQLFIICSNCLIAVLWDLFHHIIFHVQPHLEKIATILMGGAARCAMYETKTLRNYFDFINHENSNKSAMT
jgi:hypothetical protein